MKHHASSDQNDSSHVGIADSATGNSTTFWDYYNKATNFRHAGLIDSAIIEYVNALKFNPDHHDALYYLGSMYMKAGEYEKAIRVWKRLISVNSESERTFKQLGDLYFCRNAGKYFNPGKARMYFLRATNLNREAMEPLIKLGEVALYQNRPDEAFGIFTQLSQTNPKNAEAHFMLGYLNWKKHLDKQAGNELSLAIEYADQLHVMTDENGGKAISGKNKDAVGGNSCSMFVPWIKSQIGKINEDDIQSDERHTFSLFNMYLIRLRAATP
jgi:tetratricopeptide (TPR) repeat protein